MTLTEVEQHFIVWACLALGAALVTAVIWYFSNFIKHVESIANSVKKMESDMRVLANDHVNLKEVVLSHDQRIKELEREI